MNNAGCEAPLAKYLEDAFLVYKLLNGKASYQQIIATVIKILRDEVKLCGQEKALLLQGAGYFDNPSRIMLDIEKEINVQTAACFKALGDVLAKEVLEPGGVPPHVQGLIKKGLRQPKGVKFGKTPTGDIWAIWRKQLLKLMIAFIKQLLLTAARDLLEAVAGCGPQTVVDPSSPTRNRDPLLASPYGRVRINDLVDLQEIDLEKMAEEIGLINTYYQDGELVTTAAVETQLRQLNEDASDVMTDRDVNAVLQGTGPKSVYDSLFQVVNFGDFAMSEIPRQTLLDIENERIPAETARVIISEVQEGLKPGDARYGTLNLTPKNIKEYFRRLGQLLGPEISLGINETLDPKDTYCDRRDPLSYGIGASLDIDLQTLSDVRLINVLLVIYLR